MKTSNKILLGALALILILITTTLIIFSRALNSYESGNIELSGKKVEERREVASFNKLKVEGNIQVHYTQGAAGKLLIKADSSLMADFRSEVNDSELHLFSKRRGRNRSKIEVFITADSINKVTANAGGIFKTVQAIKVNQFNSIGNAGGILNVDGEFFNLNMEMNAGAIGDFSGSCENLKVDSNAGAIVNAEKMVAKNGSVSSNAGAITNIYVTGELSVFASTGSIIKCQGNPTMKQVEVSTGAMFNR
jgi:hypothetical protein